MAWLAQKEWGHKWAHSGFETKSITESDQTQHVLTFCVLLGEWKQLIHILTHLVSDTFVVKAVVKLSLGLLFVMFATSPPESWSLWCGPSWWSRGCPSQCRSYCTSSSSSCTGSLNFQSCSESSWCRHKRSLRKAKVLRFKKKVFSEKHVSSFQITRRVGNDSERCNDSLIIWFLKGYPRQYTASHFPQPPAHCVT